ncbi:MAG: hypothetical protein LBT09_08935 [Planctomycetaceae bacterium]|jgi:hypothetical protein|nr:hypothetical protein [Planctomycetaceae bacterium]
MNRIDQVVIRVQAARNCERKVEVVSATDNVRNADVSEIAEWFTGGDSQAYIQFDRENIFFHPLPYGDFALGVINPAGVGTDDNVNFCFGQQESELFFVRILIISPSVLLSQANNPVAIYEKLCRSNEITNITKPPDNLKPLESPAAQPFCDTEILRRVVSAAGVVAVSRLFQSLLDSVSTIFRPYNSTSPLFILSGIFNLLPIRFRSGLTFSTSLFLSPVIPFQAIGFCGNGGQAVMLAENSGVSLIDFERFSRYENPPQNVCLGQWSRLISRILAGGDFAFWEYQIETDAELDLDNEAEEFIDWRELNDLAIMWQRNNPKMTIKGNIKSNAGSDKTGKAAERGLEQSIAAVEMLMDDAKRKPAG